MDGALFDLTLDPAPVRPRRRAWRPAPIAATSAGVPWPLNGSINVVLFAGMGGACQGIEDAGFPVHVAVNHDRIAIAAHKALNPHTRHLQADIYEVCPLDATGGRKVGILWASPDCRDHSVAKGGAPRSPRVRSMPWQVCRWVGVLRRHGLGPDAVYLENVREIRGWGPLVAKRDRATGRVIKLDGSVAGAGERVPVREQMLVRDPCRAGRTYRAWVRHIRGLGVVYEDRDLCCADYGVPTSRRRLFGVGVLDGGAPAWPQPTHAHRHDPAVAAGALLPHASAASIIDWSLPLPSIFERKRDLVAATKRRIALGMKRFVIEAKRPFLVQLTHSGGPRVHDADGPLNTVTTAHRGEVAVVAPTVVSTANTGTTGRGTYAWPPTEPVRTQHTTGSHAVVAAQLAVWRGESAGADMAGPIPTLTANSFHKRPGGALPIGVVAAAMIQTGYGERPGQDPRCLDVEEPIGTQVAGGAKHAVVGAWMVKNSTDVVGLPMEDPASTIVTAVGPQALGAAYMVHQRGTGAPTDAAGPLRTLATGGDRGGDHVGVTAAFLTEYYGTGGQHQDVGDALNTASTRDRFAVTGADLVARGVLTPEQLARARQVAGFLREHDAWSGGELVVVGPWIVVDIGMRMLRPHEAAAAHELTLPAEIEVDGKRRPLTKTEAMRLVGNSVPKRMAQLLVLANGRQALAPRMASAEAAE